MWHILQHVFGFHTGDGNSSTYLFWSGVFGDIGLVGAVLLFVRHKNCMVHHCWRLQWKEHNGHMLCKHHHPHEPPKANQL